MTKIENNKTPSKNQIGSRVSTSMWLSKDVHKGYVAACRLVGRKSCDVTEVWERAFIKCVGGVIKQANPCPVQPIVVNLELHMKELHSSGGRPKIDRPIDPDIVMCPRSGRRIHIEGPQDFTCRWECKFSKECDVYARASVSA